MHAGGQLAEEHRVSQRGELHRCETPWSLVPNRSNARQEGQHARVASLLPHVVVRAALRGLLVRLSRKQGGRATGTREKGIGKRGAYRCVM